MFAQNLHYFGTNKNVLNQRVGQFGAETSTFDSIKGFEYGYRAGNERTSGEGEIQIRRNFEPPKNRVFSQRTKNFMDGLIVLIALEKI